MTASKLTKAQLAEQLETSHVAYQALHTKYMSLCGDYASACDVRDTYADKLDDLTPQHEELRAQYESLQAELHQMRKLHLEALNASPVYTAAPVLRPVSPMREAMARAKALAMSSGRCVNVR